MPPEPRPGSEFAGFRIERVLGRGGMGVVYLATQLSLGRRVALKLLTAELAADPGFRERFTHEARLAASLEHPNIVPVYEAGERDGILFLAMRYIEGSDLATVLQTGPLDPARALRMLRQVGDALDAAHADGLVHRDVKPGNVLLAPTTRGEVAYLTDFGLTKRMATMAQLTRAGMVVGTADYIAPEQVTGEIVDGRADQYALAGVAFECATGRPPFPRDNELATLWAHLNEDPPRIHDGPWSGDAVAAVLRRGMAKEPDGRYPTVAAFVDALGDALGTAAVEEEAVPAPEPRPTTTTAAEAAPVSRPWSTPGPPSAGGDAAAAKRAGPRRAPIALTLGGLVLAAVLVGGYVLAFGLGPQGKPSAPPDASTVTPTDQVPGANGGVSPTSGGTPSPSQVPAAFADTLTAAGREGTAYKRIYELSPSGPTPLFPRLPEIPRQDVNTPVWSRDGSRLGFLWDQGTGPTIYERIGDGDAKPLGLELEGIVGLSYGPGGRLAFSAEWRPNVDTARSVFVLEPGGTPSPLESTYGNPYWPAWSPSGTWIAFIRDDAVATLWLTKADGSSAAVAVGGIPFRPDRPVWLDEETIVLSAKASESASRDFDLYLCTVSPGSDAACDSLSQALETRGGPIGWTSDGNDVAASISGDGKWIAFSTARTNGHAGVWVTDAAASSLVPFSPREVDWAIDEPAWRPSP